MLQRRPAPCLWKVGRSQGLVLIGFSSFSPFSLIYNHREHSHLQGSPNISTRLCYLKISTTYLGIIRLHLGVPYVYISGFVFIFCRARERGGCASSVCRFLCRPELELRIVVSCPVWLWEPISPGRAHQELLTTGPFFQPLLYYALSPPLSTQVWKIGSLCLMCLLFLSTPRTEATGGKDL